jgi:hypothetical protein
VEQASGELLTHQVGVRGTRLVEVRIDRLDSVDAVASLSAGFFAAVGQTRHGAVIFADHRRASPLSAPVTGVWARDMRRANGSVTRSGILLDKANVVFNLQLARIVHCAGSASRRLFTDPRELYAWLAEPLDEGERAALEGLLTGASAHR